jgi:flagellar motor switch/type III secretory pathway protein FliN
MQARPFALVGASSLSAFRARLETQIEAWCSDWGFATAGLEVSCARAWEAPRATGRTSVIHAGATPTDRWFEGDAGCARITCNPSMAKSLQHAMFPGGAQAFSSGGTAAIATEGGEAVLESLVEAVVGLLTGATEVAEEVATTGEWFNACFRPGSGAVLTTVSGTVGSDTFTLSCLFDHPAVCTLRTPPAATVAAAPGKLSLTRALRDVAVTLPVSVGEAEVDLASLSALTVGDVIRLDAPVQAPLKVWETGGAPLLEVFLGRVGSHVAVEVVGAANRRAEYMD